MQVVNPDLPKLSDIKRTLENAKHELDELVQTRPDNGAEITLAFLRVQEALWYIGEAETKK